MWDGKVWCEVEQKMCVIYPWSNVMNTTFQKKKNEQPFKKKKEWTDIFQIEDSHK